MFILLIKIRYGQYLAAAIFVLAASTDGLDGYIARTRKQITKLGKFMDPLADKLLISAALISLVELDKIAAWVAVVIIGREFAITGLRAIAASEGEVISASKLGKLKTISQIVAIVAILLDVTALDYSIGQPALYIAVVFTILSGVDYFVKAKAHLRHTLK